ncbi:MAG TPA: 50S ribosomal protein L29 [Gemmatimonadaceae bacterium]|nr:50S ribosomal protein L29 [Gemmatimonadaceae bacterium]
MQPTEVRELNDQELEARIAELQEERFRLRLRAATQPLEQPHRLRDLRKDIARMKTVLTERRMGKGSEGSTGSKGSTGARKPAPRASKAKRGTARRGR